MKNTIFIALIGAALSLLSIDLNAQITYNLVKDLSKVSISGTSTAHDWVMQANEFSGEAIVLSESSGLIAIKNVSFELKAASILSDNSIMNKKTHQALNTKKHPDILLKLLEFNLDRQSNEEFKGNVMASLTVAGNSKTITFPFEINQILNESFFVKGKFKVEMTDFEIDPPTAMLGVLKTGNEVEVNYEFKFTRK